MREKAINLRRLFISVLAGYCVLILALFIFQRNLLYVPSDYNPSEADLAGQNLRHWPSYTEYRGFISAYEPHEVKGTIVVFHGNAAAAYHRRFYIDALWQYGYRIILAEYPGYGGRKGMPSEKTLVRDALETLNRVHQDFGDQPLFLLGESLGSAVVSSVVSQTDIPLKGLILLVPWDSLTSLAQTHYWYFFLHWLVLDQYNSVDNLLRFEGNVAVMLAEKDEVIPVKHGKNLFESIQTNKKLWLFEGAGHETVPVSADLAWWKEVSDFVSQ